MANQANLDKAYMECAYAMAQLSHAKRYQVGAILVSPKGGIIAEGVNGTPSGFDNCCEIGGPDGLVTKQECLHAESNAIAKVACSTNSSVGSTLYCVLSPCFECAKLIIQAGIKRIVYSRIYKSYEDYPDTAGIELVQKAGIQVDTIPDTRHNVVNEELDLQDEGRRYDDEDLWRA